MASRFEDDRRYPHQGYYRTSQSQSSDSHRHHNRTQSARSSRSDHARLSRTFDHGRRRSNPLQAFVEEEAVALAREHNPGPAASSSTDETKYRGEIDQVPMIIEVAEDILGDTEGGIRGSSRNASGDASKDNSEERRFILLSKTNDTNGDETKAAGHEYSAPLPKNLATPTASTITPKPSSPAPTGSTTASTAPNATPIRTPSTPIAPINVAQGIGSATQGMPGSADRGNEYEANTCRKFTVPRIDAESVISEPSTISSPVEETADPISDASAVPAAAAAAGASSKTRPTIERRKSRADLPPIDTDLHSNDRSSNASHPRFGAQVSQKSGDRSRHTDRDSRDRLGDRSGHRDNEFLSPAVIKHATKGRDRAYFDYTQGAGASHSSGLHNRARSGDIRPPQDDRAGHDPVERAAASVDPAVKRRSTSFSENNKLSRAPSYKRSSRVDVADPRTSRDSLSHGQKERKSPSPPARSDKRQTSPHRDRDRDRDRQREERDQQKLTRRDSVQKKRRDSILKNDDGYSSDERPKNSSVNIPLRRRYSDRRPPAHKDEEMLPKKASSNVDAPRSSAPGDSGSGSGRHRSGGTTPLATPKQSQNQFSFATSSFPTEPSEPEASSPSKSRHEEKKRTEDRRPASSSSASSSPEGRSRVQLDGDRPRGPRPRSRAPNIIHNPTGGVNTQAPPATQPSLQSRAATMPIPVPVPVSMPSLPRGAGSVRERDESRHERRRSPVDISRARLSQPPNPARASAIFGHSPNASQPHRPAFYINLPGASAGDGRLERTQDELLSRQQDHPVNVNRPPEKTDKILAPIYRRYAEDVYHGRIKGLPECPRQRFSTKYRDWRTLTPFNDFLICPTCFDNVFARTPYRTEFVPAPIFDSREKTRCTFGSMYWYGVATFFIKAFQMPTLSLLRTMFEKDEMLELPCSGPTRVAARWYTIQDPVTARPVTQFSTCEQCATAVQVLFPRLKGLFQDNDPSRHNTTNICALYHEPDRKRLWKYVDVLETVNNTALATNSPVDINAFINKLLDVGRFDECKRDIPVRGRKWYWMRSLPDFTVCQECFDEAVYPKVNTYRGVAGDFYKEPKELPQAACHLYSPRMRDIFLIACKNNDKAYLEQKLAERDDIAADISERIRRLPKSTVPDDIEQKKLMAEWKKWE